MRPHPRLRDNVGKLALQRGPLVYCLEEADNGRNLRDIRISPNAEWKYKFVPDQLNGVTVIEGQAWKTAESSEDDCLYTTEPKPLEPVNVKAIPYYAWANREAGEMIVWLHELGT